jgi:nucleoside-diphosphate-sugar epimerase
MRILITGKNSYIGNSFKNFLNDKPQYQVDEISVREDSWKSISFKGYDVIIHLAALVHKNERKFTLKAYQKVNVDLTIDIAKKAIAEGVSKFIFLSTMAVYGKAKAIKKGTELNPITKYGITKLQAEEKLKLLVKKSDLTLTIIRPPMIYGSGAKGNPNLIEKLSYLSCLFPESLNRKSFLSIDKLSKILFENLNNLKNNTIHPKDSNNQTTFQLFQYYRSIQNKKAYPMKITGYILRSLTFIEFINKVFGDLYYDFND